MTLAEVPAELSALPPPTDLRRRTDLLLDRRETRERRSRQMAGQFVELNTYLETAPQVTFALEQLSEQLFQQLLGTVQEKMTVALQEILEQPIEFKAAADFKRGAATVTFCIERDGHEEDIMRGQGGSVANILSVGVRIFALA